MFPYIQKKKQKLKLIIPTSQGNIIFPEMLCIMKTWMTHTEEGTQTHNKIVT